jgi:uncharacterized protein (TIGR00369 family)
MNDLNTDNNYNPYGELSIELPPPPPCFTSMNASLISHKEDSELTVLFPVLKSQLNPAGSMQGGFISAAFDNVFGPLCYRASKTPASAMVHMNTSYHRPVFEGDELTITARVKTKGRRIVHMEGEAYNRESKLVASAHCDYLITG